MYSFISKKSKLELDSPFDRKPIKLFQKVGGCKKRKTSGLLRDDSSKCMLRSLKTGCMFFVGNRLSQSWHNQVSTFLIQGVFCTEASNLGTSSRRIFFNCTLYTNCPGGKTAAVARHVNFCLD